jgi:hypothetical protein
VVLFAVILAPLHALALVDNATLLNNTIPAGTVAASKTVFTQTWNFLNTGTSTWTPGQTGYTLDMVGKDSLGATPNYTNTHSSWYVSAAVIDGGQSVPPGVHASYTLTFIAPEAPGTYSDLFQLNGTTNFGPQVLVKITVPPGGSTNQYDRSRVISYANNYAGYVVSDGYFWTNGSDYAHFGVGAHVPTAYLGDDCAHFVSCCIGSQSAERGGGMAIPTRVSPTYGEPGAARLVQTVLIGGGYAKEVKSLDEMSPGDVIGWNWEGDTNMADLDHVTLYKGQGLLVSHARSALDVSANTFFQSSEPNYVRHLIHIFDTPTITLTNLNNKVVLSWGTNWTGYSLYSSTSLLPDATWNKVTNKPVAIGKSLMVTNTAATDGLYYRLVLPP